MAFVGPFDLASALGYPGQPNHPAVEEAVVRVLASAHGAGKFAGIHAPDAETASRRLAQGFNLVTVGADVVFLTQGARAVLSQLK
jgi:2-keto-3-deoxy-L-rhamnonate aldolase RhmA